MICGCVQSTTTTTNKKKMMELTKNDEKKKKKSYRIKDTFFVHMSISAELEVKKKNILKETY